MKDRYRQNTTTTTGKTPVDRNKKPYIGEKPEEEPNTLSTNISKFDVTHLKKGDTLILQLTDENISESSLFAYRKILEELDKLDVDAILIGPEVKPTKISEAKNVQLGYTYSNKRIQDLNDDDIVDLICEELRLGMSKPNYTIGQILDQHDFYWVEKSEIIDVYFDDMINVLETREEMIEYMKEIKEKWEL